jgi:hypothetical protein
VSADTPDEFDVEERLARLKAWVGLALAQAAQDVADACEDRRGVLDVSPLARRDHARAGRRHARRERAMVRGFLAGMLVGYCVGLFVYLCWLWRVRPRSLRVTIVCRR